MMFKANKEDAEKLKQAVLAYCRLTAGCWVGGASGYAPPNDMPEAQKQAWNTMHDLAWGRDYRGAKV